MDLALICIDERSEGGIEVSSVGSDLVITLVVCGMVLSLVSIGVVSCCFWKRWCCDRQVTPLLSISSGHKTTSAKEEYNMSSLEKGSQGLDIGLLLRSLEQLEKGTSKVKVDVGEPRTGKETEENNSLALTDQSAKEVRCLYHLDEEDAVSMERYNTQLEQAQSFIKRHKRNITLGYV